MSAESSLRFWPEQHWPGRRESQDEHVWKFRGLYQRGETDGELSVDRMFLEGRRNFEC